VEFALAQLRPEPRPPLPAPLFSAGVVSDQFIEDALITVQLAHIGPRQDGDFRLLKSRAHRAKRRQRHDGIAHPIRGANQHPHAAAPCLIASSRSRVAPNSFSLDNANCITAAYTGSFRRSRPSGRFCSSFSVVTRARAPARAASRANLARSLGP